jgi:integrase
MATVNVVLRPEDNGTGTLPLALRIYKNGKNSYIYLEHRIKVCYWDKKAKWITPDCPSYKRLNNFLLKKLSGATDNTLEVETSKEYVTAKAITQKIRPRRGNSFMEQAKTHLNNFEKKKDFNRWTNESSLIKNFKEFLPGGDTGFQGITSTLLKQFAAHLKQKGKGKEGKEEISDTHIMNHMVVIRLIFNQAIDTGLVDEKFYPFGRRKFRVKFPETNKIGLTAQEVKMLEEAVSGITDRRLVHALRLFLFSFYFAGMRISDVLRLKLSDFHDGRLYYVMGKNGKSGSLKAPEKALAIMKHYNRDNPKHDLVFPDLETVESINDEWEVKRKIKSCNRRINEYLDLAKKEINKKEVKLTKKLDPHIARHTFGNISGDKISLKVLQQLYRHFHLSTTARYQQNFTYDEMDNALDAVLEEVALALAA